MGLFSKKPADSKARIEELKRKIQAEQTAYQNTGAPTTAPQSAPAPVPQPSQVMPQTVSAPAQQQPTLAQPPQAHWHAQAPPAQQGYAPAAPSPSRSSYEQPAYYEEPIIERRAAPAPRHQVEDLFEGDPFMEEIKTGIIIELGDGMSLNLPIRSRMRLDEFLHIADRVRELQRAQQQYH